MNIAVWFLLYNHVNQQAPNTACVPSATGVMFLLSAGYVFGCAFRSFLPRADAQRICPFDTWLSGVVVGRTVATVAEIFFAAQWAIVLHRLGTMTGAETVVNIAWLVVPLIIIAECFSWHALLITNFLLNAIENSIWAVVLLWPPSHFAGCCRSSMTWYAHASSLRSQALLAIWPFSSPSTYRCMSGAGGRRSPTDMS